MLEGGRGAGSEEGDHHNPRPGPALAILDPLEGLAHPSAGAPFASMAKLRAYKLNRTLRCARSGWNDGMFVIQKKLPSRSTRPLLCPSLPTGQMRLCAQIRYPFSSHISVRYYVYLRYLHTLFVNLISLIPSFFLNAPLMLHLLCSSFKSNHIILFSSILFVSIQFHFILFWAFGCIFGDSESSYSPFAYTRTMFSPAFAYAQMGLAGTGGSWEAPRGHSPTPPPTWFPFPTLDCLPRDVQTRECMHRRDVRCEMCRAYVCDDIEDENPVDIGWPRADIHRMRQQLDNQSEHRAGCHDAFHSHHCRHPSLPKDFARWSPFRCCVRIPCGSCGCFRQLFICRPDADGRTHEPLCARFGTSWEHLHLELGARSSYRGFPVVWNACMLCVCA